MLVGPHLGPRIYLSHTSGRKERGMGWCVSQEDTKILRMQARENILDRHDTVRIKDLTIKRCAEVRRRPVRR